ncbi:MAG: hypothetical protein N3F05_03510 [Candidatus Diapherotrites archaeon]|nr:hypothetical protein [Candidatus Diapherotrites archaeon]
MQSFSYSGISKYSEFYKMLEGICYGLFCFFLPFVLSHSQQQLIVGILVNTMLVVSALRLKLHYTLPVVLLPSLGVVSAGLLFGNLTRYVILLVPFIWLGNFALVFVFKKMAKRPFYIKAVLASALKATWLGLSAFTLIQFSLIPKALLFPMSLMQLITALAGSLVAFTVLKGLKLA